METGVKRNFYLLKGCDTLFHNSASEQLEARITWSVGPRETDTMHLRKPVQVLHEQISVLEKTEYFTARSLDKKIHADFISFQCSSLPMTHFRDIYKRAPQLVVSCKH